MAMNGQQQFTPDVVYNLIASNPQGRAFVENLAKMNQLQQAAQQFAPQIQQFAQNPGQAMNNIGNWAQDAVNQMQQQQPQQAPIPTTETSQSQPQPEQGGQPVNNNGNVLNMALEIVGEFRESFKKLNENLKEMYDTNTQLVEEVESLKKVIGEQKTELNKIAKAVKPVG